MDPEQEWFELGHWFLFLSDHDVTGMSSGYGLDICLPKTDMILNLHDYLGLDILPHQWVQLSLPGA